LGTLPVSLPERKNQFFGVNSAGGLDRQGISAYNENMFAIVPCAAGCGRPAISGSNTCAIHAADPALEVERIGNYITRREQIKNLSACGLRFEGMDFSNRKFYGCNFVKASFSMCLFTKAVMRMVFFDSAVFNHCDFSGSNLNFLSFGGAALRNCTFENSNLVQINFGGSLIFDSTFSGSALVGSRFVNATITNSDFEDCKLDRVVLYKSRQEQVNFRISNLESISEVGE
jgi:uncharacterized protein YjbI with pentapeptide repeats